MPNYVGSGPGGAIDPAVDDWTPVQGEQVRQDLNDHEDGLADHETRIDTLEGSSGGDVDGPASSVDNTLARYDGTTGKIIQGSGILVDDAAVGSIDGDNTGDVTLAGTPDYLTMVGQVITRNPIDLTADVTGDLPYANLTPAAAASRLLGRGAGAGAGDWQEVSLGTNLSMSGTTLNASGGGGGGALDDLSDATITTPATNEILQYNGSAWVNEDVPQIARLGLGAAADSSAKLKVDGQYYAETHDAGTSGTSKTLDWNDGNTQLLQLTGNCTLTLSNPKDGGRYLIALEQDGTGTRTVSWPSSVKWPSSTAPTLTTTAGHVDIVTLVWIAGLGASGNYLAAANLDYTPA